MNYDGLTFGRFALLNTFDRYLFWAAMPFVFLYVGLRVMT